LHLDVEVLVLPPPVLSSGLFLLAAELRRHPTFRVVFLYVNLQASWEYPSPLYCLIRGVAPFANRAQRIGSQNNSSRNTRPNPKCLNILILNCSTHTTMLSKRSSYTGAPPFDSYWVNPSYKVVWLLLFTELGASALQAVP